MAQNKKYQDANKVETFTNSVAEELGDFSNKFVEKAENKIESVTDSFVEEMKDFSNKFDKKTENLEEKISIFFVKVGKSIANLFTISINKIVKIFKSDWGLAPFLILLILLFIAAVIATR